MSMRLLQVPIAFGTAGNTLVYVASMVSACHVQAGGSSAVVLSDHRDARVAGAENLLVDYSEYCPREWFTKQEILVDAAQGALHLRRRHTGRLFIPAVRAALDWRPDAILLYEGHAATSLPHWRDAFPDTPIHLYVHSDPSRSIRPAELGRLVALTDGVICVSGSTADALRARLPGGHDKVSHRTVSPRTVSHRTVSVVPNGVDLDFFTPGDPTPGAPAEGAERPEGLQVVFAGQVAPHKGPHLLLRAMARAEQLTNRPLLTRIIGSSGYDGDQPLGEYERSLRDLAAQIRSPVEFIPFVGRERLRAYYRAASIVCVPSIVADPFGLVVLEAMACGTGVVASPMGGLPEAGGPAASYVDPNDTEALARRIADLAENPDLVEKLGADGLARAGSRSWTTTYRQLNEILSQRIFTS